MTWDYAEHSHAVKLAGGPVKYDMRLRGQGALFMLGAVVLVSVVQKSIIWFKGRLADRIDQSQTVDGSTESFNADPHVDEMFKRYVYIPIYKVQSEKSWSEYEWGFAAVKLPVEDPLLAYFIQRVQFGEEGSKSQ